MSKEYYASLPRKTMGAAALIFNNGGELLIVKPSYIEEWTIPGGVVDAHEPPRAACVREIREETALDIPNLFFLCVDHTPPDDIRDDSLQFIFHGGVIDDAEVANIRVDDDEIVAFRFLPPQEAVTFMKPRLGERVKRALEALKNNVSVYLENGIPV